MRFEAHEATAAEFDLGLATSKVWAVFDTDLQEYRSVWWTKEGAEWLAKDLNAKELR